MVKLVINISMFDKEHRVPFPAGQSPTVRTLCWLHTVPVYRYRRHDQTDLFSCRYLDHIFGSKVLVDNNGQWLIAAVILVLLV